MNTTLRICLAIVILVAVVRITATAAGTWEPSPGDYIIAQVLIILAAVAALAES